MRIKAVTLRSTGLVQGRNSYADTPNRFPYRQPDPSPWLGGEGFPPSYRGSGRRVETNFEE